MMPGSPPSEPCRWLATVTALYPFERANIGDHGEVVAQTAFSALRLAEPLLGVAKEHIQLRLLGPVLERAKAAAASADPIKKNASKQKKGNRRA